jgi:lysophospholipase L1-like esterase
MPGGVSLGLQRLGVNIWWQGRSGLIVSKIRQQMNVMMRLEDPPDCIIIHIGGNDIGNVRIYYLQLQLKQFITWVSEQLPHASIVFPPRYCHAVNDGTLRI